jgi:hypothetical protein
MPKRQKGKGIYRGGCLMFRRGMLIISENTRADKEESGLDQVDC